MNLFNRNNKKNITKEKKSQYNNYNFKIRKMSNNEKNEHQSYRENKDIIINNEKIIKNIVVIPIFSLLLKLFIFLFISFLIFFIVIMFTFSYNTCSNIEDIEYCSPSNKSTCCVYWKNFALGHNIH